MATNSKKGACSANIQAAKANCLQHDRRDENSSRVPSYVNHNLSGHNHTIFEDDMIKGRASIVPLVKRAELLYTEKTGQRCQKSFTPFREDCLSLPGHGDITDDQIKAYLRNVEEKYKIKALGAWYHKDEGHPRSKYIEGDTNFEVNYHIHVLYYCQDPETGKAIRLPRSFFTERQDFLAQATGLERGNPAKETRRQRRSALQQRIEAQEQRIEQLQKVIDQKDKERDKAIEDAKASIWQTAKRIFGSDKTINGLKATIKAQKDKIEALQAQIKVERQNHKAELEKTRQNASKPLKNVLSKIAAALEYWPSKLTEDGVLAKVRDLKESERSWRHTALDAKEQLKAQNHPSQDHQLRR